MYILHLQQGCLQLTINSVKLRRKKAISLNYISNRIDNDRLKKGFYK